MSDEQNALQAFAKPVDTLINRISDAVGVVYEPRRIRKKAEAEAKAKIIATEADIAASDLRRRTVERWIAEETKRQQNVENILDKTILQLEDHSKPENLDEDWLANYFDKVKTISNEEAQSVWAKLLADEANEPGKFSKRTVNVLHTLDKPDASLFEVLSRYVWSVGYAAPLVFDHLHEIYNHNGIDFTRLQHLESIGLIHFNHAGAFAKTGMRGRFVATYCNKPLQLEFSGERDEQLNVGKVRFTQIGQELFSLTNVQGVNGMYEYVAERWTNWTPKPATQTSD